VGSDILLREDANLSPLQSCYCIFHILTGDNIVEIFTLNYCKHCEIESGSHELAVFCTAIFNGINYGSSSGDCDVYSKATTN